MAAIRIIPVLSWKSTGHVGYQPYAGAYYRAVVLQKREIQNKYSVRN
jgi:hypothetical protein